MLELCSAADLSNKTWVERRKYAKTLVVWNLWKKSKLSFLSQTAKNCDWKFHHILHFLYFPKAHLHSDRLWTSVLRINCWKSTIKVAYFPWIQSTIRPLYVLQCLRVYLLRHFGFCSFTFTTGYGWSRSLAWFVDVFLPYLLLLVFISISTANWFNYQYMKQQSTEFVLIALFSLNNLKGELTQLGKLYGEHHHHKE